MYGVNPDDTNTQHKSPPRTRRPSCVSFSHRLLFVCVLSHLLVMINNSIYLLLLANQAYFFIYFIEYKKISLARHAFISFVVEMYRVPITRKTGYLW